MYRRRPEPGVDTDQKWAHQKAFPRHGVTDSSAPGCNPGCLNRRAKSIRIRAAPTRTARTLRQQAVDCAQRKTSTVPLPSAEGFPAFGEALITGASVLLIYPQGAVFDSYPLMLQAAVEGHGIAMGWRRTAGKLIESGALVRPCAESVPLPEAISVFRQQGGEDRVEVRALIGWLEEELRSES